MFVVCAYLRPDWDDDGGVEGQETVAGLLMLLQQTVEHSEKLYHPLITSCTWSQRGLNEEVSLRPIVTNHGQPSMTATVAPNNGHIGSDTVQLHRVVRRHVLQ